MHWFREAHRLQPDNWTYKRQAWTFVDPLQGPTEPYDSDWLSDVKEIGAENYYPEIDGDMSDEPSSERTIEHGLRLTGAPFPNGDPSHDRVRQ